MTVPAVEVRGVSKQFGEHTALDDVSLMVQEHEFLSLLGPSGCGKTTLLRIISGFEQPSTGRVLIHGQEVTAMPPDRRPTNIVFQRGALFPHMNVAENIGYSLKLRKWPRARIAARVDEMLELVRLDGLGQRGPTELSGGQIQRAALARALAAEPRVLLLDEPLSALDLKLRQHMQLELRAIQRKLGATFVYVTHDQSEALVMSDRIAIMNEGRIVQEGTPREIYTRPVSVFASDFIGETNLLPGTVQSISGEDVVVALGSGVLGRASAPAGALASGARVTLSVRPEAIRVRPADDDAKAGHEQIAGAIREIVYLGNRLRIEVEVEGGIALWAELRDEEAVDLRVGSAVKLSWSAAAASAWSDSVT
jgi:spermidine/putrescine transport system ATP-binding protein